MRAEAQEVIPHPFSRVQNTYRSHSHHVFSWAIDHGGLRRQQHRARKKDEKQHQQLQTKSWAPENRKRLIQNKADTLMFTSHRYLHADMRNSSRSIFPHQTTFFHVKIWEQPPPMTLGRTSVQKSVSTFHKMVYDGPFVDVTKMVGFLLLQIPLWWCQPSFYPLWGLKDVTLLCGTGVQPDYRVLLQNGKKAGRKLQHPIFSALHTVWGNVDGGARQAGRDTSYFIQLWTCGWLSTSTVSHSTTSRPRPHSAFANFSSVFYSGLLNIGFFHCFSAACTETRFP